MTNVKSEGDDIARECTDIKREIKKYFKQLYVNKFDNLDKFLERYKLLKFTLEGRQGYLSSIKEITLVSWLVWLSGLSTGL